MASGKTIKVKGKVYTLSLPMSKVEMAEDLLGNSLLNVFNPIENPETKELSMPKISELVKVFYVLLLDKQPETTLESAQTLLDEYLEESQESIFNLFTLVGRAANFFKQATKK